MIVLLLFFGAPGAYDVGINTAAISFEQRTGRRIIPYFHASFSGTAALVAIVTGLLIFAGVPFRLLYGIVTLGMAVLAVVAWRSGAFARPRTEHPEEHTTTERAAALFRSPALVLLAIIAALAFLSEGTLETWSAIYLRSTLNLPAIVSAAGPAVFHAAMLIGRVGTGHLVGLLGRQRVLILAGAASACGMLLALAGGVPVAFSLAGDHAPERSGEVSSAITTVGYSGFLVGPALIGGLAELLGLRLALGSIVVAGVLISGLSMLVKDSKRDEG